MGLWGGEGAASGVVLEAKWHGRCGARLSVRLTPKAAHNKVVGVIAAQEGKTVLKVAVTAVPEKGKANAALVKLLAKSLGLPKSAFLITSGQSDRNKQIFIEAQAGEVRRRLDKMLKEIP